MKRWTKVVGSMMVVALLMTVLVGTILAQGPGGADSGDGVRDLEGSGAGYAWGFTDEDGDGVNDREFVDEDGDGLCDICGGVPGTGAGAGYGRQGGAGMGGGEFVDEDGDGLCDDCGSAPGTGAGGGYGQRRGRNK